MSSALLPGPPVLSLNSTLPDTKPGNLLLQAVTVSSARSADAKSPPVLQASSPGTVMYITRKLWITELGQNNRGHQNFTGQFGGLISLYVLPKGNGIHLNMLHSARTGFSIGKLELQSPLFALQSIKKNWNYIFNKRQKHCFFIFPSFLLQVIEFDDGSGSVLRIQPLRTPRDEAIYECHASNSAGEITASTRLSVLRGQCEDMSFPNCCPVFRS